MLTSYHNHTNWSDGTPTIADQIMAAAACGLDEIGISDHFVLSPFSQAVEWSMPLDKVGEYAAEIQRETDRLGGITVRLGVEADYFPETVDGLREILARYPFDYVIGSVHFVDGFPLDAVAEDWEPLSPEEVNHYWRLYWQRIREMAKSGVYDFAAHLDLPKKFGYKATVDLRMESNAALDAIAEAGMAIEINTAGWEKPIGEAYPALELLRAARAREIPLLINSDAHETAHLTRHFERARELAREAAYSEVVRYERRNRYPVPL